MRSIRPLAPLALAAALAGLAACGDTNPTSVPTTPRADVAQTPEAPAPAGVVQVALGGQTLDMWPFTGVDFSGTGQDPINLVFAGQADPRQIRAALMTLNGDRTAFGMPNAYPFNCTWSDAIGGVQTGYAQPDGWTGSAVQLECGFYQPLRFHLRLFREGTWTIANAHFELLIPGTADHQVLSWELAEQLVTVDMVRLGLLGAPPTPTAQINPAPTFRDIPAAVYNGLPVALRGAIGGPSGNVSSPVGINTNGRATMFLLARAVPVVPNADVEDFILTYNQIIPKPFCAQGPGDLVQVQGPLHLRQVAQLTQNGDYSVGFRATGTLALRHVESTSPLTLGAPYSAEVLEKHEGFLSDLSAAAAGLKSQREIPAAGPYRGSLLEVLRAGTVGRDYYQLNVGC